ncbi:MAG: hypothetical protein MUO89_01500 [Dehalococcoidia bacterium]|nr:hypothetical protein [Dehalococcoidia bacterium]
MTNGNRETRAQEISKEKADKLNTILTKLNDKDFRKNFMDDPAGAAKRANIELEDVYYLPVGASFTMDVQRFIWCSCSGCGCCCTASAGKGKGCGEYGGSWS